MDRNVEVGNVGMSKRVQEDVVRFEIPMKGLLKDKIQRRKAFIPVDDSLTMEILKCASKLGHPETDGFFLNGTSPFQMDYKNNTD